MYAAQETQAHTQAGVSGSSSTPPVTNPASVPDYSHAYPGYNADAYSYDNNTFQNYSYNFPQQGNPAAPQHMGGYDASAAPYHSANAYQNPSYANTTHYQTSTAYYSSVPPGYQNPVPYQHGNYSNQWAANGYGGYAAYSAYQGYPQHEANGPNHAVNNQYTQDYQQQWANYYASLQNGCKVEDSDDCTAPGTEPVVKEKALPISQPPPPGTQPTWDLNEPSYPDVSQANNPIPPENSGVFVPNPPTGPYHGDQYSHIQPSHFQQPSFYQQSLQDQPLQFKSSQDQPSIVQGQQVQTTQLHIPGANFQQKLYSSVAEPVQRRANKLQIPTNPRIVSTPVMNPKVIPADTIQGRKPAYLSVEAKPSSVKVSSDASAESVLKPDMFPPSLRAYVERALARCKDEGQKRACQEIMKEMITKASKDGTLFTKNWDTEPLFPLLPVAPASTNETVQGLDLPCSFSKQERSPTRRAKSRWEPVTDVKSEEKLEVKAPKDGLWNHFRAATTSSFSLKWEKQDNSGNKTKPLLHQQLEDAEGLKRAVKKARKSIMGDTQEENNSSEESENEIMVSGGVCLGTITTVETPEEKMRRQSRTKRFDKSKEVKTGNKELLKPRMSIGASASARRATALLLARSAGDGSGGAVEDINWDALTVKGTCQEVEKRYLRLTSAPDPNTVRPEEVLRKALVMVQSTQKNYLYKCEQLKSIRQDLTVQRIRNELTVQVYETHARMALEAGDLPEYNQCQSQLKGLYAEGIRGCNREFVAYGLLYIILHHGNNRDLLFSMARLSADDKKDVAIRHALAVRSAVAAGDYTRFFRLYKRAPNLGTCLMDLYVEKMRFEALRCMTRAYRPILQVSYIGRILGFTGFGALEGSYEKDQEDLDECEEWLRAHGAILVSTESELCVDCKASMATLLMPEPEDAVAHGDANLAVNDFLAQV
ncbi:hypothetical protein KP509_10G090000 [Ceratopteris richardii]|uniref:PCI domain-containing protein n=1 Tax=Ceratopteris richardii TaxID=49495 RepID=A0A8T2TZH6_CERRI|nr:hypothetical protein KP509_10G090000 [Ceratopteris richardii]